MKEGHIPTPLQMLRVQVNLNRTSKVTNNPSLPKTSLVLLLKVPGIRKLQSPEKTETLAAEFSWLHLQFSPSDYLLQSDPPKAVIYLSFLGPEPGTSALCQPQSMAFKVHRGSS